MDTSSSSSSRSISNKTARVKVKRYKEKNSDTPQLAYFYLRDKLKISKKSLMNIVVNYPWLLYLKVESNIRPTIDAYRTFGFKISDVRLLIEVVPSTLGLNADWSIPERLISLQKLFYLSQPALINAVKRQPYLVTCSVNRHIKIANFFSEFLGLSSSEIRNIATFFPDVLVSNLETLQKCYSYLTDVYGFSVDDIRHICVQCPRVFTKRMLLLNEGRLELFIKELNLLPPFQDIQKLVLKIPSVLCMSAEYFLIPNFKLIKEYLYVNSADLGVLITNAPHLLRYKPVTLRSKLESTFSFLTGENKSVLLNDTAFDFRCQDLSVEFIDAIFEGRPTEPFLTYLHVQEEDVKVEEAVISDELAEGSEITSDPLDILMQQLASTTTNTSLTNATLSAIGEDIILEDIVQAQDNILELELDPLNEVNELDIDVTIEKRSRGDRAPCPFVTPDDLLRLDVISDIAHHHDSWGKFGFHADNLRANATLVAQLLDEVNNLDGRSGEATLAAMASVDKAAARWTLKDTATLRLPLPRARQAVKMFLPILGYDPMRLHK